MKNMGWNSIKDQLQLCLHDTVYWNRVINATASMTNTFTLSWFNKTQAQNLRYGFSWNDFNGQTHHPMTCAEATCHEFCGGSCWGPGIDQYQHFSTGQLLRSGQCVSNCSEGGAKGYYTDTLACFLCYSSCETCTGTGQKQCQT